jgi:predicted dehydrogenase
VAPPPFRALAPSRGGTSLAAREVMAYSRRDFLHHAALGTGALLAAAQTARAKVPLAPPDRQSADAQLPEVVKRKLGVAVVGLGKLALEEVMPAFAQCRYAEPVALVSGHPDKARQVAAAYGIRPGAIYDYAGYERLAQDPRVDAVYIILPNSMHAEYTVRAVAAGKHVLCEKPMATSPAEAERMIAAAAEHKRTLMIAYRLQYEPIHRRAIEMSAGGELGMLKVIEATNCQNVKAPNIRLSKALGGGPLGDVGIYCINAARYLTREMPAEVTAMAQRSNDPRFAEVPESVIFTLRFPSGVLAHASCSFGSAESRYCRVTGADAVLEIDNAFTYRGLEMHVRRGGKAGRERVEPQIEEQNHFALELDHFARAILDGKPVRTPGAEGLADLRVIAAVEEAARTGRAARVG